MAYSASTLLSISMETIEAMKENEVCSTISKKAPS
jgi:hypothetical protein